LSYGNAPRGGRSGGKGGASKKTNRKKKQEFHRHRQQPRGEGEQDADQLRSRVVASLENLGHQRLSTEPGGYDLQSWIRSFDSLLDDFEAKVGSSLFSEGYRQRRQTATAELSAAADLSTADRRIGELRARKAGAVNALAERKQGISARIGAIDSEVERLNAEATNASGDGEEPKKQPSFFRRLFGGGQNPSEDQVRSAEIASRVETLKAERASLEQDLERVDSSTEGPAQELVQIEAELATAEAERERTLQISEERERLAGEFSKMVAELPLGPAEK